ncbi:MAG: pyridoxal-phosphate dependent enzyme, partial [Candidatus Spechtbacterales bacterium]
MTQWRGIIEEFKEFLPITDKTPFITLGEGNTPLVWAKRLAREIGFKGQLHLKYEGANPTGSFKDRGMAVAVSKALEEGAEMLMCASTGNTASSAAAYGAKAGLPVAVLVPRGGVASGKRTQILAYGAKLVEIKSNFDACQEIVKALVKKYP